jgi:3-deoxy-D-manno-octulosonic-acid transferase
MRLLYSSLLYLLSPLVLARLYWRGFKAPAYRQRWRERFGFAAPDHGRMLPANAPSIWLHAVSVGESRAALPLIEALIKRYPEHRILVTTSTPTGSNQVESMLGDRVWHSYSPYDLPDSVSRFIARTRPDLLIIMETELWPNTIAACHARDIPVIVANARLSEKSAKSYGRVGGLSASMLGHINKIACQHQNDAARFHALGVPEERTRVIGNIKFDVDIDEDLKLKACALKTTWTHSGKRLVLLAASTHRGEDEILLAVFKTLRRHFPHLLLVLVPRHPERFESVLTLSRQAFSQVSQRSLGEDESPDNIATQDVIVADTMGEMMCLMGASDLVFVGGSLIHSGGHNIIEPAHWGLPIVSGDSLFNFSEASRLLSDAGALNVVSNEEELVQACTWLCENELARQEMGARALQVAGENRGALQRLLNEIESTYSSR